MTDGYYERLTTTGDGQVKGVSTGAHKARHHVWQVINHHTVDAAVRPYGSLSEEKVAKGVPTTVPTEAWTALGAGNTTVPANAASAALIVINDTPLSRVKLNVVTLGGSNLDVLYVGAFDMDR